MTLLYFIISALVGLIVAIPLVKELIKYVKISNRAHNWTSLLAYVLDLMKQAENKFDDGKIRKEWVLVMVKGNADTIDFDIDMDQVSCLIDDLCDMSEVVNAFADRAAKKAEKSKL